MSIAHFTEHQTCRCGEPADAEEVAYFAEQARAIPPYWREQFAAEGNPAGPEGMCGDCAFDWYHDLKRYREVNRCDGSCSPYSTCLCQLMLPESEY